MKSITLFFIGICSMVCLQAQEQPISDNSFLIEEAYNQEPRVVQHINNFIFNTQTKSWDYSLTQEWPMGSMAHQFSYSIPYSSIHGSTQGLGDAYVNYRYQWLEGDLAVSPRISVILPTGNEKKELGSGKLGYQVNLPVSKRLAPVLVGHFNAGATLLPDGKNKNLVSYSVGASVIWLTTGHFNVMLEWVSNFTDTGSKHEAGHILSPGLRYAYDAGSLQIVPGIGFPIQLNADHEKKAFLYLSVEHPF